MMTRNMGGISMSNHASMNNRHIVNNNNDNNNKNDCDSNTDIFEFNYNSFNDLNEDSGTNLYRESSDGNHYICLKGCDIETIKNQPVISQQGLEPLDRKELTWHTETHFLIAVGDAAMDSQLDLYQQQYPLLDTIFSPYQQRKNAKQVVIEPFHHNIEDPNLQTCTLDAQRNHYPGEEPNVFGDPNQVTPLQQILNKAKHYPSQDTMPQMTPTVIIDSSENGDSNSDGIDNIKNIHSLHQYGSFPESVSGNMPTNVVNRIHGMFDYFIILICVCVCVFVCNSAFFYIHMCVRFSVYNVL